MPVAIVEHRSRFGSLISQIFRQDAERVDQSLAIGDIETVAVKVGEHPLVRVEGIAVGELQAILDVAEFRT